MKKRNEIIYSEIFHSVQGEGKYSGIPSVFFRTSTCNIRCWWCDTKFASFHPENKKISVLQAYKKIMAYNCEHVVLTGGEPLIQPDVIQSLILRLHQKGKKITVETNGTRFVEIYGHFYSISPKLKSSMPRLDQVNESWQKRHDRERINWAALEMFMSRKHYQFKFVVSTEDELDEIRDIQKRLNIPGNHIYLMPEGTTVDEIMNHQETVARMCIENGWNYSDRLHVRIWGNKRGV